MESTSMQSQLPEDLARSTPRRHRAFASTLLALAALASVFFPARTARAEFPTLERAIQLARERAIVVAEAQGEMGVAQAQLRGARVSSFGNPYTEVQVDKPWNSPQDGLQSIQAMTFNYFPVDIAGQRGKRIE